MPGFDHAPKSVAEPASPRRTRLGLRLFVLYLALYVGFVLLNAVAPAQLEPTTSAGTNFIAVLFRRYMQMSRLVETWTGLNIAVLYGLGLIFAGIVLAGLYDLWCRRIDRQDAQAEGISK